MLFWSCGLSWVLSTAHRHEAILFPERLDDDIAAENPIRFLDAFVDHLDLTRLGCQRATPTATGRPAYNPADLLKLSLYGYLYRLRSSRRLEQETHRNVLWSRENGHSVKQPEPISHMHWD